ncbi:hypothetical protein [Goodfellowiella coeruleoviolacea]|uniref:Uncharacterized protein n=1 Tax=Goodfellowiella coeruleoviolacea TaxID=334858 RepID=A0AAE3GQS4_9PSEU|nr:hypothetical protein [Goodfellowiella coeruleoviolacea]MCP2170458.1 hypothetical protein [Goodfellowiella coeruleoviolacea]
MCDDEQDLPQEWRGTLRSLLDQPSPPSTTDLDQLIRLGRRRLVARRLVAAVGVLAAVAGIGIGAAVTGGLRTGEVGSAVQPTHGASLTTTTSDASLPTDWQKPTGMPTEVPYGTWSPAPGEPLPSGATAMVAPLCKATDDPTFEAAGVEVSPQVRQAVVEAVTLTAPRAEVGQAVSVVGEAGQDGQAAAPEDAPTATATTLVDVTDRDGTGSVSVRAGLTRARPEEAADAQVFVQGNCEPPVRRVLDNGTVLQLYPVRTSGPYQSLTQALRLYTPAGMAYEVAVHNWGSPDLYQAREGVPSKRVSPGRATLPLTERQLAEIGTAVAAVA